MKSYLFYDYEGKFYIIRAENKDDAFERVRKLEGSSYLSDITSRFTYCTIDKLDDDGYITGFCNQVRIENP